MGRAEGTGRTIDFPLRELLESAVGAAVGKAGARVCVRVCVRARLCGEVMRDT